MSEDYLSKSKEEYASIIEKIASEQSAVGIDAQYTHAVIIAYLRQLDARLKSIEEKMV